MSFFGPFRPIQRGDRILDARQLNKLMEIAQRLGNLSVSPPLVLNKSAAGFQLALNQTPDAYLTIINSIQNSDGYYDASVLSWNPSGKTWSSGESVWLEDASSGTLASGQTVVAVDTNTRDASGGDTRRVLGTAGGGGATSQLVVIQEYADYLACVAFTQPVSGSVYTYQPYDANLGQGQTPVIYVAKPYQLQQSPWQGKTISLNGTSVTFNYTGTGTRTATNGSTNENQVIVPDYFTGDLILAAPASSGLYDPSSNLITLMDLNCAARAWALKSS